MLGPVFRTYEPARDRLAAVKAFRLDVTPEQARALADELQRLVDAGLMHPSIVAPIAAGIEGSVAYLAEEYVAGESLDVAIRHYAPAALDKALPFIAQLAGAIDFARAAGVGHGTLHPRDIFITPEEARATGFGISGALEAIGVRPPVRRPYSAPERVAGAAWGAPADVFTLGAIAYELLTGRRIAGAVGAADALDAARGSDPVPAAIVGPLSRALAEDPAARYQSGLAFARALEAAADGEVERDIAAPAPLAAAPAPAATSRAVQPLLVDALENETAHRAELDVVNDEIAEEPPELALSEPFEPREPREPLEPREPREPREPLEPREPREPRAPGPLLFDDRDGRDDLYRDDRISTVGVAQQADRPRGSVLPLTIVLIAGLLVGFVAGYAVGSRTPRETPAATDLTQTISPASGAVATGAESSPSTGPGRAEPGVGREGQAYSEQKVGETPQPAADTRAVGQAPAAAPAAEILPARGTLTIRSTPSKAGVVIDGRWRGRTPLTLSDLLLGDHTVRVVERGYVAQDSRVMLTAERRERQMTFTLPRERGRAPATPASPSSSSARRPAQEAPGASREPGRPAPADRGEAGAAPGRFTGSLYVDSRPSGAQVFLDGRLVGTTPLQLGDVVVGSHVVRLALAGHRTWASTTRVVAGQVARVTGSLEQVP